MHVPGRSWYVHRTHHEIRVFVGGGDSPTVRTYRRPASASAPEAPAPAASRRRLADRIPDSPTLRRLQVFGLFSIVAGFAILFADDVPAGNRPGGLLFLAAGVALLFSPVIARRFRRG
ncbi:hypothetical protein GCM10022227_49510 [Streptomyces sedi]